MCPVTSLSRAALACILLCDLSAAQPSLRGLASPAATATQGQDSSANPWEQASLRRTGASDGTIVNPTCVDYTAEGYFPARHEPLIDGVPDGIVNRPATISACELEQLHQDCVDRINMYRSGELKFSDGTEDPLIIANPRAPLGHNTGFNQCSSQQTMGDLYIMYQGSGCAHYTSGTCPLGGVRGQNSCCPYGSSNSPMVTYDTVKDAMFTCLQGMWDEAMGLNGTHNETHDGHHKGMENSNYQYASCGFSWNSYGQVLITQDFTSAAPAADNVCSCAGKSAGESDGCGGVCTTCAEAEEHPCTDNPGTGVWSSACTGATNQCTCEDHMTLGNLNGCEVERVKNNCPLTCGLCPSPSPTCPTTAATTVTTTIVTTTTTMTTVTTTTTVAITTTTTTAGPHIAAEIIEGTSCDGDDCSSVASCPAGTSVIECASEPANGGDGVQVETTKCVAKGSSSRRRRRANAIKAIAVCSSSQSTSVTVSNDKYLEGLVTTHCSSGNILSCYCHSAWSVCGETVFAPVNMELVGPSTPTCVQNIGSSSGRRRGVGSGAGARVYALCDSSATQVTTTWGTSCTGDDCSSVAACPVGTSVIDCASLPANGGDGIQVQSTKCIARGANNRRRVSSIKAVAVCSSLQATSVVVSSAMYLDKQEVSASCPSGNALSCFCHSSWTSSVCGGTTEFLPSGSTCKKSIGASSGRRRMVGGGAGAKIYALCSA